MSKTFNLPILLSSTTLAFALGWFAPSALHSLGTAPKSVSATPSPIQSVAEPDLLSRFKAINWNDEPPVGADTLAPALASSAALRTAALERYRQEPKGVSKNMLGQFLTAQQLPEIFTVASQWAQQADSASARADGFNLLGRLPPQAVTYSLARHALEQEKDPLALASAVWILSPPRGPADPAEVARVVPRLHALTQHPLATLRSASIQRIAEWDRGRRHATQDMLRLLSDPEEDVRIAAIGATSIALLTDNAIKLRLMVMLTDARENEELRKYRCASTESVRLDPQGIRRLPQCAARVVWQ